MVMFYSPGACAIVSYCAHVVMGAYVHLKSTLDPKGLAFFLHTHCFINSRVLALAPHPFPSRPHSRAPAVEIPCTHPNAYACACVYVAGGAMNITYIHDP